MLALSRKLEESIVVDLRNVDFSELSQAEQIIEFKLIGITCGEPEPKARIGCIAARDIPIHRKEVWKDILAYGPRLESRNDLHRAAPKLLEACKKALPRLIAAADGDGIEPWEAAELLKCFEAAISLADSTCPTCGGSGAVIEMHEMYAGETLGCPHCMGTGKKDAQ